MFNELTNKEIEEWSSVVLKYKTRCKCGHKVFIDKDKDKVLCQVCKNYVFKNKSDYFKYKLKKEMRKNEKWFRVNGKRD